ncbi:hypothetical protein [Deinococcus multiflagellatus]|uniref:Uncharacterized protein n=1 Tax=Deinococcus multiflagellatus TaxID=1656887 RepID=A0ABW1ZU70_9DEIO|nr:hypothetical protein [Deinococcus multiflagellatus]MBZ9715524.1 hypothetical protein [Deinococcus multiflagellatus]
MDDIVLNFGLNLLASVTTTLLFHVGAWTHARFTRRHLAGGPVVYIGADPLAPVGHRVRLQGRDYLIETVLPLADGRFRHQLRPC